MQRCPRRRILQLGPAPDQGPDPDRTPDLTLEAALAQDPGNVATGKSSDAHLHLYLFLCVCGEYIQQGLINAF